MNNKGIRALACAAVAAVAAFAGAAAGGDDAANAQSATTPSTSPIIAAWTCRASTVEAQVSTGSRLAPIATDHTPCTTSTTGVPNVGEAVGLAQLIRAKTAYATTAAAPAAVFPKDQTITSSAGVEGLQLGAAGGTVLIGVDAAQSQVTASCVNGKPELKATSNVANLVINGQTVSLDGLLGPLTDAISGSPLGALVTVKLNEEVREGDTLIRRAAHVKVLPEAGAAPLADVVIAESKVSSSEACNPNAINNGGGQTGGSSTSQVCPTGSELDTTRGVCVIPASATAGQGLTIIGLPYVGPSGGRVVALDRARQLYKSPCLSGPGPRYVVVGTNKRDRITGTNGPDRVLARGGNDAVDGGRGDDCLDGGTGRDSLSGALGTDRVYGQTGNDAINGGSGNDRLDGAAGNDTMNAAFGRDKVTGGAGRDFINVATAGAPATVDCGSGADKARLNAREKRTTRNCEVMYVLRDR